MQSENLPPTEHGLRPHSDHLVQLKGGSGGVFKKGAQHGNSRAVEGDSLETMSMNSCSCTSDSGDDKQDEGRDCFPRRGSNDASSAASSHTCRSMRWSGLRNKLFDRHNQKLQLSTAYDRFVNRGLGPPQHRRQEIVIITGPSGSGKTSLARDIETQARMEGCPSAWLYGKCEKQFQEREPFGPIVQAVTKWLTTVVDGRNKDEKEALLTIHRIEQAFLIFEEHQLNTVALFDLVPAFLEVLRDSRFVHPEDEDQKGFRNSLGRAFAMNGASPGGGALCQFLKAFCSKEHSIVLLLDDWQWLDSGSLHIIQTIATMRDLEGLLLIGTCRGDEMTTSDDLCVMLRDLEENDVCVTEIQVGNLPQIVVAQMIQELLDPAENEDVSSLAALTHGATNGNPFLVVQFLRAIACHGVLYFSVESDRWQWDESFIETNLSCFESSEMIDATLQSLVQDTDGVMELLKVSSCLGTMFDFELLKAASDLEHSTLNGAIDVLQSRGLFDVVQSANTSKIRWSHDRFLHAAASLVPDHEKVMFRVEIASRILPYDDLLEEHTFLVATLLFDGAESFLETKEQRLNAAALFNLAGNQTARLSAFSQAASYFRKGIELLPSECWQNDETYGLCTHLYNSSAEMECCLGHHEEVDKVVKVVQRNARSLHDKLLSHETEIYSLCARGDAEKALDVAFRIITELGEPVPKTVSIFRIVRVLWITKRRLRNLSADDILNLRPLRQWNKLAAMRIIHIILPTVMRCKPDYLILFLAYYIKVTLQDGITPLSAFAFMCLGMLMCYPLCSIQDGLRYDEIGYRVFQKYNSPGDLLCRVYVLRYGYIAPWRMSVKECIPRLLIGAQNGLQTGDFEISFVGMFDYCIDGLLTGFHLEQLCLKMIQIKNQFSSLGQLTCMVQLQSILQLAENLRGNAANVQVLVGPDFDVAKVIQNAIATGNQSQCAYARLCQMILAVFLGDYHQAISLGVLLQRSQTPFFSGFIVQYLAFLLGLSEVIASRTSRKTKTVVAGRKAIKRLQQLTKRAPEDWIGRSEMISAEMCAARGRQEEALRHWRRAISCANTKDFVHEEALAMERAGLELMEWNRPLEAWNYFQQAREAYAKWGFAEETLWNCKRYLFGPGESYVRQVRCDDSRPSEERSRLRNNAIGDQRS
jgi:predicted ATPase